MKITIFGAGRVGGTLGRRFAELGHKVNFVVRDKNSDKSREVCGRCGSGTALYATDEVKQATVDADAIIVTLPWTEVQKTVMSAAPLTDKVVIDATNPLELSQEGLSKGLLIGHTTSAGEKVAQWLPQAKVSKAFNTIGWEVMQQPLIDGERSTLLICGDPESNKVSAKLASELGFAPLEIGDIKLARLLEPFGMLWIHLRFALGWSPDFALTIKRAKAGVT